MNEDILLGLKLAITNTEQELTNEIDSLVTAAQKKAKAVQLDLNIDEGLKKLEKTLNGKLKGVNFNPELKKFFEAFSSGDIKDIGKAYEEINNKALLLTKTLTDAQLKLMDGWSGEQVNKFVKRIIKANEEIEKAARKQSKYENIPEYVKKTRASENSIKKTLQGKKNKSDEEILDQFERAGLDISKITKKELSSFTYYEKLLSYQKELIENDKALANPKTQKEADAQIENAQKLIKVTELLGRSREQLIEIGKKLNQNEDFTIDEVQSIDPNLATKYAQEWNKIVDKAIAEIRRNINSNLAEELEETSSKYLSAKVERNTVAINQQRAKRAKAIAPVDKEDVGTTEQYTEALNGVDNELDDVQEGVTATANSLGKLKEKFKDVEKYLVDFETALNELNKYSRKSDLSEKEIDHLVGYITRIDSFVDSDQLSDEQLDRYYEILDKLENKGHLSSYNNIKNQLLFGKKDDYYSEHDNRRIKILKQVDEATSKGAEAYEKEARAAKEDAKAQQELANAKKEVVQESSETTGDQSATFVSIDTEEIKKQLQEAVTDFNTKFSDALNNSIKEFSDKFSNVDYYQALEPLRRELLNIVQQFKNSLKDLGIENSDLNKLYETLDAWNISSHISTEDDRERLMLGNIKSGKTSVAVSGSEASISGELQQRLLTEVSKRIDGNISDIFDMWIHSHPLRDFLPNSKTRTTGADIGFSYGDLQSELNHYFEQGIKKMLVTNNGKYSMLDFSKISKEVLEKFISQLAANLEKSGNFSIETDKIFKDGKGKIKDVAINRNAYVKDGVADLDKKSELINNAILETINSSKELKQIIFETGDITDLKIDEVVQDEKNLANQSEELLNILNQIRNILNDMSTSGGGNSNLSGIFNIHLIADVDYLIERIQRTLDDHDFKIKVNLASGQSLDESDEGAINIEGFSADRATDSFHALNYEKSENIELNAKLRKNANESAKALANEAEKAEAADKALTELNKRKRANNKLNEEKPKPKKDDKSNLLLGNEAVERQNKLQEELKETESSIDEQTRKWKEYSDAISVGADRIRKMQIISESGTTGSNSVYQLLRLNHPIWDEVKANHFFNDIPEEGMQRYNKILEIVEKICQEMLKASGLTEDQLVTQLKQIQQAKGGAFKLSSADPGWTHFATYTNNSKDKMPSKNQLTYKIYASFDDIKDLNENVISELMDELTKAGFKGRLKTTTGSTSFGDRINALGITDQLVVHGATKKDQEIAYNTIQKLLGNKLSYLGGGIDTKDGSFSQTLASGNIGKYVKFVEHEIEDIKKLREELTKLLGTNGVNGKQISDLLGIDLDTVNQHLLDHAFNGSSIQQMVDDYMSLYEAINKVKDAESNIEPLNNPNGTSDLSAQVEALDKVEQEFKETGNTAETEATTFSSLLDPLEKIKTAITEKNNLFLAEEEVVKNTTTSEFDHLGLLLDMINEIIQAIDNLNIHFGNVSFDGLTNLIKKLRSNKSNNETIEGIVGNLDKLAQGLNKLKIDDTSFIDSVNRIIDASKQLKNVVKDAETVNKANKKAGAKSKKEKDPAVALIKELSKKNNDILKLNNKKQTSGLTIDEEGKLATLIQQYNRLQQQIEAIGITTNEATKAYQKFKEAAQDAATGLEASNAKAQSNELESQRKQLDKLEKKAKEVYENIDKYREGFRNNLKGIASKSIDLDNIDEIKAKIKELTESLDDKSLKENLEGTYTKLLNYYEKIQKTLASEPNMAPAIKQKYRALADEIDNLVKSGDVLPGVLNRITKAFIDLNAEDAKTKGFFRAVADRTREMNVKFLGQFFSFYDIIRYGREVFNVIKELDTSLVDLRKTTAMTAKELDEFYYESNKIARQMGVTTNEIITQASAWSRLGYNTAEATKQMAQLSSKFASISPGMDVDKAQEGLVSIMKAWDIETDEAERKILDNINTLGNKFAETNADIVTGMEKSAATFAALGQSAEDAFALFTGAQEVMQNAEVVGTALKTLSLRIRGYDEETEELSEDLVNLKGKVVDLTKTAKHTQGISLFTDASQTHYKSMVQYLGEISEIWDEIDEKSRTELLDKLFGKRGASVGSAIIGNFDQVKKALAEMETAAGSAESEMDIIRDSVEFKLNELKNVWIGYIQQLLKREDIGEIIDQLIEGSESLQSVIDAATPLIHEFIELLSDLLGVLADIAKSSDMAIPALGGLLAFNGINNKLELFKYLGNKKVFDGMSSAIKGTALESSKLTKSFISLSSLLTSPGFWGLAGVVAFSAALYKLYKSEEEIYKQAQEATKEYDNREKSLEKYKTKIIELRKTADDSTLSIEEQQKAREELLSIQSEMVDQFGAEAANVDILRDSIDRLNDSFDTLSESSYQEFLNSVNRNEGWDGFWHKLRTGEMFDPSVANATYIQDQMENASSQLFGNVNVSTKSQQKLAKLFNDRGFDVKYNEGMGEFYMSPTNLQDYYDTLLDIQIKYRDNQEEIGVSTYKELSKEVERVNEILTSISPTYNKMLEHDTIMPKYQDTIDKLKTAMSEIYNARVAEDEKGVEAASKRLTQIYDNFLKTVDDPAIINWFEQYIAEYEAIMNKTRFTEGLNNNANYQIAKTNNKKYGYTKEELEAAANMDDEAINNIADIHKRVIVQRIKMAAHDAEIPVSVVIDQLEADKAAITGLEKQLREIHGDFKIDSLSPEDLQIVLNLSNALHLSWEQIQKEIVKSKQHMKEMSKIEMIDNINDMADGFDKLDEVYADVFDKGSFDFTTLASKKFEEAFSGLDPEIYAEFIETVSEYPDDLGKTQEAFDKLAGAFIEQRGILDGLTNDNKKVAIQMLENMGIANAEEVVTERLNAQLEAQRYQSEALAAASADVVSGSYNNSKSFLEQASMSDYAKIQLMNLVASQTIFSNQNLSVGDKIRSLESLASAYMGTAAAAELSQKIQNDSRYSKEGLTEESLLANWNKVTSKYTKLTVPNVKYTGGDKTKDAKDKAAKSAEKDKELFDWIETKVQRIEREITNLGKIADATYKTWGERTVALGQEMEKVTEQIGLQQTAYATYMKQAEAFDLSKDYKDKVINGALAIDEVTDDVLKKKIKDFKEIYEKALAAQDKIEDLRSSFANLAKAKFDNITTQFDDIISDVEHMTKYITAQLESVETVGKIAGKSFYEAQIAQEQERLNDLTQELGQLQSALAEGLASGAIAYGSQMFNEMKKSIYSVEESILDANNAILKFEQSIKQVAKANFDDLKSQFESAISILTDKIDLTDKIVNMVQATGHIASKAYYDALITGTDQNIQNLKKKYDELSKVFNDAVASGDVKEFSDEWYDMKSGIEAVKGEIIDATNSLIEYKNQLRQINWDLFDRGQTRLEQLISESQFLIDLYEKYPLFDKETGDITSKGMATRGLLVQNYETYIQQASLLADEIARLKEELKADPKNTTLIDRLRELEEAERSAILASEGVKESLRDLLENEINALLEALQKLIDQYKKNLQAQKDLHDFQKNIDQQNKNINALKKQLMAYDNGSDTTEENRARVQKINDQLKQAEDQLKETEYDRYIQETQTLLDDFMQSLRDYFDEKLLDLNWVLERAIEDTNLNAETIRAQIEQTGQETGYVYTEEFTKIWDNMTASDSLFSEQRDILASTSQVCTDIQAAVMELPTDEALGAYLDGSTLQIVSEIASVDSAVGGVQSAIGETNQALAQIQSKIAEYNASVLSSIADAKAAAERAQQAANAAQQTANAAKSGSGSESSSSSSSGEEDIASGSTGNKIKYIYDGHEYTSHAEAYNQQAYDLKEYLNNLPYPHNQNKSKYRELWLKSHPVDIVRYAKGGRISDKDNPLDFLAQQLGEDHMVAAKEGERILTAKQNENFEKLANAFSSLSSEDMAKYSILTGNKMIGKMPTLQMPTLRSMEQGGNTEINGGISINLPNVTNKAEFVEWLKTDGQIEKIVQSMTLGKLQGRNSYDKMKY